MIIEYSDAETGNTHKKDTNIDEDFVEEISSSEHSDDHIKRIIDKMAISADAKHLLYKIAKTTIKIGRKLIQFGKKILEFIIDLHNEYPNTTFMMIFGAIAGVLISTIPIIGAILGALVIPLSIIFGLAVGVKEDIKDKNLARKIAEINAKFNKMNT